jgi:hypothetical protein
MYVFELNNDERILEKGMATLYTDEHLSGALYLTNRRLVFVGYINDISFKHEMSVQLNLITEIKSAKTFKIIPNAIEISTRKNEQFRLIVQKRDEWMTSIKHAMAGAAQPQR